MIFGCGIDIEEIDRFDKHYFEKGRLSDLVYDLFTSKEIENFSVFGKEAFLKGFCFKEAFYKALNNTEVDFMDVEIIFNGQNGFKIYTSKKIDNIFSDLKITDIKADIKLKENYAVFKVLLIKQNNDD
ncbi:MAG: 4'-phosphopantetheinyl transferase superfamily protein [Bacteroidales bacterium]|nr:4'-phosphopantetheinyl transferase superfamily protein [Bacteroidales bacterium]